MDSFNCAPKYEATSTSWITIACLLKKHHNLLAKSHLRLGALRELSVGSQQVAKCIKTLFAHTKEALPYSVVSVLESGDKIAAKGAVCEDLEGRGGH